MIPRFDTLQYNNPGWVKIRQIRKEVYRGTQLERQAQALGPAIIEAVPIAFHEPRYSVARAVQRTGTRPMVRSKHNDKYMQGRLRLSDAPRRYLSSDKVRKLGVRRQQGSLLQG